MESKLKLLIMYNKPIWILSHARSGSVFLSYILHQTGLFPGNYKGIPNGSFFEHFNINRLRELYFTPRQYRKWGNSNTETRRNLFYKNIVEKNKLPNITKIMRQQYIEHCGFVDKDKEMIESMLPGIKYVFIERKDIYKRVISMYFATVSGKWVLEPEEKNSYLNKTIPFNETEILKIYKSEYSFASSNNWDLFLNECNYIYIDFDDFIKDKQSSIVDILKYLGIKNIDTDKIQSIINSYPFHSTA